MIDIPEGDILENPAHVRYLEEHGGVKTLTDGAAHHAHEVQGIRDVFKRHLAHNEVGLSVRVPLGVEVLDELDCITTLFRLPLRHECWIKTYASISAHGTEHRDEFTLAASDLEHGFVAERIALNQLLR